MSYIKYGLILVLLLLPCCGAPRIIKQIDDPKMKIFNMINQFRRQRGIPALEYLKSRQWEVDHWSRHLERFEHARRGYTCENIAVNFESAEELFYQWKESPGHRRNMLLHKIQYCTIGLHGGKFRGHGGAYFGVFRGYRSEASR